MNRPIETIYTYIWAIWPFEGSCWDALHTWSTWDREPGNQGVL